MDAHVKNIEAATTDGKYDPAVGLLQVILNYNFTVQDFHEEIMCFYFFRVVLLVLTLKKKKKMIKKKRNLKM